MRLLLVILSIAALLNARAASGADDLAGTWIWSVEGRNVVVLQLEEAPQGLTGTLQRPTNISLSSVNEGWAVTSVELPVVIYEVAETRRTADGLTLHYTSPSTSGDYLLRLEEPDRALFAIDPDPRAPRVTLHRPRPADEVATDWPDGRSFLVEGASPPSNAELAGIFAADQADRHAGADTDWSIVAPRDRARRERVREMLDRGLIRTGQDYRYAAFVFQHGDTPEDYLLAHALAMAAQAKGKPEAAWIAAASLDRFLTSIDRQTIFGTQFGTAPDGSQAQKPVAPGLVTDAIRAAVGVPPLAEQQNPLLLEAARGQ